MNRRQPTIDTHSLFQKFGGRERMRRHLLELGYAEVTLGAMTQWLRRGTVPARYIPALIDIAINEGYPVTHRDFLEGGEHPAEILQ
jgi:hypothetical protein